MPPNLTLKPLFTLDLSAASGLVTRDEVAWVVADDRLALDSYRLRDGARLPPVPLLHGAADEAIRKKKKPDLEALMDLSDGRLLALGSGSRPNRERAFLVEGSQVEVLDLSALYERLRAEIGSLNIEGAVRDGRHLLLSHRGLVGASCIIRLDAEMCLRASDRAWPASTLIDITRVELGSLDGVPLSLTDLALSPGGVLHYLAAAENTDDAYLDGHCAGSVIGYLEPDFLRARHLGRLRPDVKAEGLAWAKRERGHDHWLAVTDADDRDLKATMYGFWTPVVSP
ncbi:MAG: DUF6929 family protein [Panacagrimonas sp.]